MQPEDDGTLLRQYAENQSNEAFAALVTQHINLVYSVAVAVTTKLDGLFQVVERETACLLS